MSLRSPDRLMPWFLLGGVGVLSLLLIAVVRDVRRPWKPIQRAYLQTERAKAETPAERRTAANLRMGIRQIRPRGSERVDRCTTCHLAVDHPDYADGEPPLRTHPNFRHHPFEEFGCTVCHRGNGLATTVADAHEGMLPTRFVISSCMACHEPDYLPGVERLLAGRAHFRSQGCLACHQLEGEGGRAGPALDGVGLRRELDWILRHFQDPAAVSPGSAMPPVQLDETGIEELALYVLGFSDPVSDPSYITHRVLATPEAGRDLFFARGCIGCHALEGEGGSLGSDLSRLGRRATASWLDFFLRQPHHLKPGTRMPDLDLPPDERAALVAFLVQLNDPTASARSGFR